MTDQINDPTPDPRKDLADEAPPQLSQVSAFIDNELSAEESALLVRRFEKDTEARARAMRYTLIGASLRGELLEPHPSVLRQRISAALSGGTAPTVAKARERSRDRWTRPLFGVGIAATVAVAAIGTLRWLNDPSLAPAGTVAPTATALEARGPAAYVVPQNTDEPTTVAPRLTNYLMHHSEFASGLTRTSVNSNVVGGARGGPVLTETAVSKPIAEEGLE